MKKLSFVLALSLLLVSSAFAGEGHKNKNGKYRISCENNKLVAYDQNGTKSDYPVVPEFPTSIADVDTTKQSVKEFNKTISKCGKIKEHKNKKHKANKQK